MMPSWGGAAQMGAPPTSSTATYQYPPNPAYIPVPVQQSFGQAAQPAGSYGYPPQPPPGLAGVHPPPTPPQNPQNPPQQQKIDWPDSVRAYVQRTFVEKNQDDSIPKSALEAKLKEVISAAKDNGHLYSIDWDHMPLPQALIRNQREEELKQQSLVKPDAPFSFRPQSSLDSKKRKSTDMADDNHYAQPPWRSTNPTRSSSLEDRISFSSPDKRPTSDKSLPKSSKFQKQLEKRQRLEGGYKSGYRSPSPQPLDGPVVGTNETLEKRYLRLTAPPVASQVRPERILKQTLELLKRKWRKESNYAYVCDQFKSLRQDLTVQRIKNDFTVEVYEIHARIALEKGDLGEYNQCQTQLRSLYQLGLKGNPTEFKAYRILYFIHTANRTGLTEAIMDLTAAEKQEPAIKHALDVRRALVLGNYHSFFQLYLSTPNMGAYLMDMFVVRERLAALCKICKVYKPDVKLRFIAEELGFESDMAAAQFILDYGGQHLLEDRSPQIFFLTGKAGGLFEQPKQAAFAKVDIKGQI